jgi:hypothetical protein
MPPEREVEVNDMLLSSQGASLKDAGRLTFAAAKMSAEVIPGLLESIRKATSERREYGKGKKSAYTKAVSVRSAFATGTKWGRKDDLKDLEIEHGT